MRMCNEYPTICHKCMSKSKVKFTDCQKEILIQSFCMRSSDTRNEVMYARYHVYNIAISRILTYTHKLILREIGGRPNNARNQVKADPF